MPEKLPLIYTKEYLNQVKDLAPEALAIVDSLIENVLREDGVSLASGSWLSALRNGVWEFRIGQSYKSALKAAGVLDLSLVRSRRILIRVFCAFEPEGLVLLGCFNKLKHGGGRTQNLAINRAKDLLLTYRRRQ
jgi:hypothetical protein